MAASIPGMYEYAPTDVELYKTADEQVRKKVLDSMDLKDIGVITVDEWLKFYVEHIIAKAATHAADPIFDHGNVEEFRAFVIAALIIGSPEYTEMYWFLLELFTESDPGKDGIVILTDFSVMVDEALEMFSPPTNSDSDRQEVTSQRGDGRSQEATLQHGDGGCQGATSQQADGLPQGDTPQHGDGGCQGTTSQHEDGGCRGVPSQHGDEGHHGAKERRQEE